MKWVYGVLAITWFAFFVIGWFHPATIDNIPTISRSVDLAMAIIFLHMAWGNHK